MLQTSSPRHLGIISILSTSLHMCHAYCQIGRTWHLALTYLLALKLLQKSTLKDKKWDVKKNWHLKKKLFWHLGAETKSNIL